MHKIIKICGIKSLDTVDVLNQKLPDYIGFVFVEKSPRYIDIDKAVEIKNNLDPKIKIVSLTVSAEEKLLSELNNKLKPNVFQLHGKANIENNQYIDNLAKILNNNQEIWKAFPITSYQDIKTAFKAKFENNNIAKILLDSGASNNFSTIDKNGFGGSGHSFNWNMINEYKSEKNSLFDKNFILAGGLNINNVENAINICNPLGVDVSSGVEIEKGIKSPDKIDEFIKSARKAFAK